MRGKELTCLDREKIEYRLACKQSHRSIAKALKRDHTVIDREIDRNKKPDGTYSAGYAQELCDKRRVRRGNVKRKLDTDEKLRLHVVCQLKEGLSPDVIAGRLQEIAPVSLINASISHEAIYGWLYEGEGHALGYWKYLPGKRQRRRRHGTRKKHNKTNIPDRVSIHARDDGIDERITFGHWETDSIIYPGSGGQRLSVQIERKARLVRIHRLPSGNAQDTLDALRETICSVPQDLIKTITFDNGSEGVRHKTLTDDYDIWTYFADTYASWQKGSVEQVNGIIRRHLPKGTDLRTITNQQIYAIQEKLNNTPRKILGYKTPNEVFFNLSSKVVH
ncbi:MAG: IS30 family transposase [Candidatus Magasanikbacteria bacterium]|nr:IS30 family transposase [Candidatus Magasanikbacteria bacterium]